MKHPKDPPSPETLLQNATWVGNLARSLAADCDQAEDLFQDTWVRALERRPGRMSSLRGWLVRVMQNLAKAGHRSDARRMAREARAGVSQSSSSPDEVVARGECHSLLVRAVMDLEEPYRSTILMRYFEGRSSAEIARRLDISAATVRSRVKRGLGRLRQEIEGSWGADWLQSCLLLVAGTPKQSSLIPTTSPQSALPWITAMNAKAKFGLAIVVLIGALLTTLLVQQESSSGTELLDAESSTPSGDDAFGSLAALRTRAPSSEPGSATRGPMVEPGTDTVKLALNLVDLQGRPLAQGTVSAMARRRSEPMTLNGRDLEQELIPKADSETITTRPDRFGQVRLEALPGEHEIVLVVRVPGHALRVANFGPFAPGEESNLGEFALAPAGALEIAAVDQHGYPIVGVAVVLETAVAQPPGTMNYRSGQTGEDGHLRIEHLIAADWSLTASSPGYLPLAERELKIEAGVLRREQLALDPGSAFHGVVLEQDDSPAVDVLVHATPNPGYASWWPDYFGIPESRLCTRTDKDGRFRIAGLEADEQYRVFARRDPAWVDAVKQTPQGPIVLKLPRLHPVHGKLVFADGHPVDGASIGFNEVNWPRRHALPFTSTDEEGRFRVDLPPGTYGVGVFDPRGEFLLEQPVIVNGPLDMGRWILPRGCVLELQVLSAVDRSPVPEPTVQFMELQPLPWHLGPDTWKHGIEKIGRSWQCAEPEFRELENSRFLLEQLLPGDYEFAVYAKGFSDTRIKTSLTRKNPVRLEVLLEPAATVSIRLLDARGVIAPGRQLQLLPKERGKIFILPTASTHADGLAVFDDVRPGLYRLRVHDTVTEAIQDLEITAGDNAFEVRLPFSASLAVFVQDAAGPVAGAQVRARVRDPDWKLGSPHYQDEAAEAHSDTGGQAVLERLRPGEYLIHVWAEDHFPVAKIVHLEEPGQEAVFDLGGVQISGSVPDAPVGTEVLLLEATHDYLAFLSRPLGEVLDRHYRRAGGFDLVEPSSGSWATAKIDCAPDGSFVFRGVPDGRYFVSATAPGHQLATFHEFEVARESIHGLSIHLSPAARVVLAATHVEAFAKRNSIGPIFPMLYDDRGTIVDSKWALRDGVHEFSKLAPGKYILRLTDENAKNGRVLTEFPLELNAGETIKLEWDGATRR